MMHRRTLLMGLPTTILFAGCSRVLEGSESAPPGRKIASSPVQGGRIIPASVTRKAMPPLRFTEYRLPADMRMDELTRTADGALWFRAAKNQLGRLAMNGSTQVFTRRAGVSLAPGLFAGPDDHLWFCDWFGNRVGRISMSGVFAPEFELRRSSVPSHLAAAANGEVWAGSHKNGRIWALRPGQAPRLVEELRSTTDFASGPAGNVWAISHSVLFAINPAGEIIFDLIMPHEAGTLDHLTLSAHKELWFTDPGRGRVYRLLGSGDAMEFDLAMSGITDIAPDAGGGIWGLVQRQVFRLAPTGELNLFSGPDARFNPLALEFGGDGHLWVSDALDRYEPRVFRTG